MVTHRAAVVACACSCVSLTAHSQTPLFTDHTAGFGVACQFEFPPGFNPPQKMIAGGAVGDFNRDGYQDLFILAGGSRPDALYINNGDGTFTDRAADWGVDRAHLGSGAAVADVNGDGWLDIYVTSHGDPVSLMQPGHHALYMNNGDGTFTDNAVAAGVDFTTVAMADGFGASFGDYDLDGDLDLAVAGWMFEGGGNRLFRNDGTGHFEDVTAQALPASVFDCRGFSPWFHDMDGDFFPELLWTSDFATSRYFINNGDGTFTDFTIQSGTGLDSNGMGSHVGDVNNDGLPDWYVTSIDNSDSIFRSGNMLYINQGGHIYVERALASGVNQGGWGWGADMADLDHDADLDLMWTNGWGGFQVFRDDPTFVCLNRGDGIFKPLNMSESGVTHTANGRGLLTFDADNDGDRELVIFSHDVPTVIYRNELIHGPQTRWLTVALDTSADPGLAPDGIGAHITATTGALTQHRWISASPNYLAQSEMTAHFGLAGAALVDTLTVRWPNGRTTTLTDVPVDQRITIAAPPATPVCAADITEEGACAPGVGDGLVSLSDFACYLALWSSLDPIADITGEGACVPGAGGDGVTLSDFSCFLAQWSQGCP